MCPIPYGPRRSWHRSSSMACVLLNFWTDKFLCGGGQVGGSTTVNLGSRQFAKLKKVLAEHGRDYAAMNEFAPELCKKFMDACYKQLDYNMALEAYSCYDFSGEEFKGWTKSQKIAYIRKHAEGNIREMFSIGFEIANKY